MISYPQCSGLPVKFWIDYNILLMTFKTLNGLEYLRVLLVFYDQPWSLLQSNNAGSLLVPTVDLYFKRKPQPYGTSFQFIFVHFFFKCWLKTIFLLVKHFVNSFSLMQRYRSGELMGIESSGKVKCWSKNRVTLTYLKKPLLRDTFMLKLLFL